jgi:hypothetical protein
MLLKEPISINQTPRVRLIDSTRLLCRSVMNRTKHYDWIHSTLIYSIYFKD